MARMTLDQALSQCGHGSSIPQWVNVIVESSEDTSPSFHISGEFPDGAYDDGILYGELQETLALYANAEDVTLTVCLPAVA